MASHALEGLSVRELKARLQGFGCTDFSQFLERCDLVQALSAYQPELAQSEPHADVSAATPNVGSTWANRGDIVEGDLEREVEIASGCTLRVAERRSSFDNSNTGAVLWDASVRLARHVFALGRPQLAGKRVVELGCGTGLAGLAAGVQGAQVVLTDLPEVLAEVTEANLQANLPALRDSGAAPQGTVALQPLAWGDGVGHLEPPPPFDYVLAADVVYRPELFEPLRRTLLQLAGPGTRVLLAYTRRRSQEEWFFSSICEDFDCKVVESDGAPQLEGEGTGEGDAWRGFTGYGESAIFLLVRRSGLSSL